MLYVVAMVVYFTYSIHHSKLNDNVSCSIIREELEEMTVALLHNDDDDDDGEDVASL